MGAEERWEFNEVMLISPVAVGVPGKRTFFLGIGDKNSWVRIWLEKEHLQALAQGIDQLFSLLSQKHISFSGQEEAPPLTDNVPLELPSVELDIIQMALGYDDNGKAMIEFMVERSGAKEKTLSEVYCRVMLTQLKNLGSQSRKVCAAGRPLCPICGRPIDPSGHICSEQN